MIKHLSPISGVAAYSSKWIATAGYDNSVILWNVETGKSVARANHDHLVNFCAFSKDGTRLVTAGSDFTARVFAVPSMRLLAVCPNHEDDVEMAAFDLEGGRIVTASRDHRLRVFSSEGVLTTELIGHTADVISVCVAKIEGLEQIISTSDDGTVRRWSFNGKQLEIIDMGGVETDTLVITAGGSIIAGTDNGDLVVKGVSSRLVRGHQAGIKRLVFDEARSRLISISYDRTCKLWKWDGSSLTLENTFELPYFIWPRSCAILNEENIVFGTFGSKYALYNLRSNQWITEGMEDTIGRNAVAIHNGNTFAIGDSGIVFINGKPSIRAGSSCNFILSSHGRCVTGGQSGQIIDAENGALIYQHTCPLNCGTGFEVAGRQYICIGTYVGEILVLEVVKDKIHFVRTLKMHTNAIKSLASGGGWVFSVSANREAASIETLSLVTNGKEPKWLAEAAHKKIINGCAYLGENRFASVSRDLSLRIWDAIHGRVAYFKTPHSHSVKCMAVSADGRYIATGAYNGMIAILDLESSEWISNDRPTTSGVSSLCPSPQGFLASSYDGRVYEIRVG